MRLLISFEPYQSNWYVGELYTHFFSEISKFHEVEYISMRDLANRHGEPMDYKDSRPSIFNIYNLIIQNKDTGRTFVHSLNDYATVMLEHLSAIRKLNVVTFACTSNLTSEFIARYIGGIKLLPSFYVLENWNDIDKIFKSRNMEKTNPRAYFNGLCYGNRGQYKEILKHNSSVDFNDKNDSKEYVTKDEYYNVLSKRKYGLSLNGAAGICYRDLEYFGMGVLNLREHLNVCTAIPLKPDVHYKVLLDSDIQSKIYNSTNYKYISDRISEKISSITDAEVSYINSEASKWFDVCATPVGQTKMLLDFTNNSDIS